MGPLRDLPKRKIKYGIPQLPQLLTAKKYLIGKTINILIGNTLMVFDLDGSNPRVYNVDAEAFKKDHESPTNIIVYFLGDNHLYINDMDIDFLIFIDRHSEIQPVIAIDRKISTKLIEALKTLKV